MPAKIFQVEGIGTVAVYRRRGTQRLTIRMTEDGVRVSTPPWAPYRSALAFVESKRGWIQSHQKPIQLFKPESRIGKYHQLAFVPTDIPKATVRVTDTRIIVRIPAQSTYDEPANQTVAKRGITKALIAEGRQLLPQRLQAIAQKHGFTYTGVTIRQLKSRWGSCSSLNHITLNCYLMQLPWKHIDYVLIHELAHTQVHAHDERFWKVVTDILPESKQIRREMRDFQPTITVP